MKTVVALEWTYEQDVLPKSENIPFEYSEEVKNALGALTEQLSKSHHFKLGTMKIVKITNVDP